jgi:hypothetical protein
VPPEDEPAAPPVAVPALPPVELPELPPVALPAVPPLPLESSSLLHALAHASTTKEPKIKVLLITSASKLGLA